MGPRDLATARDILERAACAAQWWRVSKWACRFAVRYGDAAWFVQLLDRVCEGGADAQPALRLLTSVRVSPTDGQREALARLVLLAVETGDSDEMLEWGPVVANSAELRQSLLAVYQGTADGGVRRRAWWAIAAIRRDAGTDWPGDEIPT